MIEAREERKRRGGPLAMLAVLAIAWIGGRALLWESPFAANPLGLPDPMEFLAEAEAKPQSEDSGSPAGAQKSEAGDHSAQIARYLSVGHGGVLAPVGSGGSDTIDRESPFAVHPQVAAGHQLLWLAALGYMPMPRAVEEAARTNGTQFASTASTQENPPPFGAPVFAGGEQKFDSWSLDAWAFWREGSNAAPISQGRVPIYGASQVGAALRYRFAPRTGLDPMLYTRAYRALVSNGETEVAAGIAARPVAALPVRAYAELRYTDNRFGSEVRPAAFAVTELPTASLPLGLSAEAYAQAGFVGGDDPTPFADGQVILRREVAQFDLASTRPARLSVGAGAWGGAQEDAARLDLGPTLRLDLSIGQVPARISVDWREQVAGDAAPASGVAATVSTRF